MFSGLFHDVLRMFSGCSDGSCGPGGSRGSLGSRASSLSCESSGFGGSIWLGGSEGPSGSCESCGSGWDGGPGGSSGSCWSCGSWWSGGLGESAWLGRCGWYQVEFQLKVWILIIQKSTVIPPSLMVLFRNDQ